MLWQWEKVGTSSKIYHEKSTVPARMVRYNENNPL